MDLSRYLEPKFWLLAIAAALVALHLTLLSHADDTELFATSVLFWVAAGSLLWDKYQTVTLQSGVISSAIGSLMLILLGLRVASSPDSSSSGWAFPLVAAIGLGLLASSAKGLRQYWKELTIFGLLAIYPFLELTLQSIDLSEITAKAATLILGYLGLEVQRQGVFLNILGHGATVSSRVQVYGACSGIHNMLQMLNISVLFLLMFPVRSHLQKMLCVGVAIAIGFVINSIRVALMAILNNAGDKYAFDYWHEGTGSLMFSAIAVLLFGCFCWFAFLRQPTQKPDSGAEGNA
ncbi:MAG: cyanoexosortase A [Leptolyngbyaceae cyanobacterium RU_5_1]|nr:cyanoexosortase A [Leptolyngbyaceae cyanobacterium RU_5_1]